MLSSVHGNSERYMLNQGMMLTGQELHMVLRPNHSFLLSVINICWWLPCSFGIHLTYSKVTYYPLSATLIIYKIECLMYFCSFILGNAFFFFLLIWKITITRLLLNLKHCLFYNFNRLLWDSFMVFDSLCGHRFSSIFCDLERYRLGC